MESIISKQASLQPANKTWYRDTQGALTYGDQRQRMAALDQWCRDQGLERGDMVLVATRQEREQASLLCALICLGFPPVIVNPESPVGEMIPILKRIDIKGVIADERMLKEWNLESRGVPALKVAAPASKRGIFNRLLKTRQTSEMPDTDWPSISEGKALFAGVELPDEVLAYLVFTSGTTSLPKGVKISHRALASQMDVLVARYGLSSGDCILNALPFNHVDGLIQGPLLAWVSGATMYRPASFSPNTVQTLMDSVYRERVTHMIAVPTMLSMMLRLGTDFRDNFQAQDFRLLVSAAGHLEKDLWEKIEEAFGVPVLNMYGLSETVTSALFNGPDNESRKLGTLGLPVNCHVRIVDISGSDVAEGDTGELWISSEQLMDGYYNEPEATKIIMEDGWLRSGDLVKRLPSGHIELVGRLKNLIISGGRNISPEEISACLNTHSSVIESVVLGVPDPDWGEWVAALVVPEKSIDEMSLIQWCRENLSEYKVPKRIFCVSELRKGPSGKILQKLARAELETLLAGESGDDKTTDHEEMVISLAARSFKVPKSELSAASSPENTIGWDSLAHMELVVAIEKSLGIRFSPRDIMQIDCLQRAIDLVVLKAG